MSVSLQEIEDAMIRMGGTFELKIMKDKICLVRVGGKSMKKALRRARRAKKKMRGAGFSNEDIGLIERFAESRSMQGEGLAEILKLIWKVIAPIAKTAGPAIIKDIILPVVMKIGKAIFKKRVKAPVQRSRELFKELTKDEPRVKTKDPFELFKDSPLALKKLREIKKKRGKGLRLAGQGLSLSGQGKIVVRRKQKVSRSNLLKDLRRKEKKTRAQILKGMLTSPDMRRRLRELSA